MVCLDMQGYCVHIHETGHEKSARACDFNLIQWYCCQIVGSACSVYIPGVMIPERSLRLLTPNSR
eukprot:COSAG01_NODE_2898_length_6893_cov_45.927878_11_plen_65_part_00